MVARVLVYKVHRMDQAAPPDAYFIREMMEHQHALAETIGTNLKATAVRGEWVTATEPCFPIVRLRMPLIMFAVVEDNLEHPIGLCQIWLEQAGGTIAIGDALQVAVGCTAFRGTIALVSL